MSCWWVPEERSPCCCRKCWWSDSEAGWSRLGTQTSRLPPLSRSIKTCEKGLFRGEERDERRRGFWKCWTRAKRQRLRATEWEGFIALVFRVSRSFWCLLCSWVIRVFFFFFFSSFTISIFIKTLLGERSHVWAPPKGGIDRLRSAEKSIVLPGSHEWEFVKKIISILIWFCFQVFRFAYKFWKNEAYSRKREKGHPSAPNACHWY